MNRRDAIKVIGVGGATITLVGFPKAASSLWDTGWRIHCTWINGEKVIIAEGLAVDGLAQYIQQMQTWEFPPTTVVAVAKNGEEFRFRLVFGEAKIQPAHYIQAFEPVKEGRSFLVLDK